jgi:uncharacterized protein (TIGR02453 family)
MDLSTLAFLGNLKSHNSKEWMDANRDRYMLAKQDFENFVTALIKELAKLDPALEGLQAKQCIFRINRDIRFSKDKAPYKANFGAAFSKGGRKSPDAGYYFHLEPGSSFVGGGIWMPGSESVKKIRQEIDYNFDDFDQIVSARKFKELFPKIDGEKLQRPPRGYDESNPAIAYLKLKSFTVGVALPDTELRAPTLLQSTMRIFKTMRPFIDFLNTAV